MLSIAAVSFIILITGYQLYQRMALRFVQWVTARNAHLAIFMVIIFVVPIILLLV
jgi:hypothetical protein